MLKVSVCTAGLLQFLGYSFFIIQPTDQCSPAPPLGSWVFLLATLCFLMDISIYPRRFMHMAKYWQVIFEVVATIFLAEILTLVIWCNVERVIFGLTHETLLLLHLTRREPSILEYMLLGVFTVVISGAALWFILEATNYMCYVKGFIHQLKENYLQVWELVNCIFHMDSSVRRSTLKACKLALSPTWRRRRHCQRTSVKQEEDEEDEEDEEEEEEDYDYNEYDE